MELVDLVNMARISSQFFQLANNVFRRKYSDCEVKLVDTHRELDDKPYNVKLSDHIDINDLESFSRLMKVFGNQIRKLTIPNFSSSNYTSGSDWAMVNRIVNEYGAESVVELKLGAVSKGIWPQFTVPFTRVENLEILIDADTDGKKLNDLCPNLRKLNLIIIHEANYDLINCKIPHLEYLKIFVTDAWKQKEQIIGFIEKNPQIRSIYAPYTTPEFTKMISEKMRYLENLTINFNDNRNIEIHFENVKHLVLHTRPRSTIRKLSISKLESLEITFGNEELDKYIEFFSRHKNLSKLNLKVEWHTEIDLQQFDLKQLTAELPNLKIAVTVRGSFDIHSENVIRFIESHSKLTRFEFPIDNIEQADQEKLRKRFETEWHIWTTIDNTYHRNDNVFVFERRK